ncbi:MAG: T9SS type A sorting domain-containing protein [Flavobacteriales bacterium]|nr:T9SS type A sorting domain-containing protein [Flavobacteriales bacterium]
MKTVKRTIALMLLILFTYNSYSQDWQWARQIGGNDQDGGVNILSDKDGNIYVNGEFLSSDCYFQTDTLHKKGDHDFFLVKYNENGNEVWINQYGGFNSSIYSECIEGMCFDSINDFIYITGSFSGTSSFGSYTLTTSNQSFFIIKLDLNGNCVWAKQATGVGLSLGSGVAVDKNGDLYVCGTNSDTATFDTVTIPRGGFIAKYDASGNCLWAKNKFRYISPGPSEIKAQDIIVYDSTLFISGDTYNDTIVVDTITTLNHVRSVMISSFDLDGNIKWIKMAGGGNSGISGWDFSVDENGNSYICGRFTATGYFDTIVLTNPMNNDAFIAKYNLLGELQWVKQLSATGGSGAWNIHTSSDGTSYVTGYFNGTANFGSYNVTSSTNQDMFVARYDSNGTCLGIRSFGKAQGTAITVNSNNEFWVSGQFWNNVLIGNNTFSSYNFWSDMFIVKGDAPIGIETYNERKTANALHIYANPNQGTCNITVPEELLYEQNLILTIYDVSGKIIQQQQVQIAQEKIKINLEAEAKGVYQVTLGNAKKIFSGKIVFE